MIWSPKLVLLERKMNIKSLLDEKINIYERVVTYEGNNANCEISKYET